MWAWGLGDLHCGEKCNFSGLQTRSQPQGSLGLGLLNPQTPPKAKHKHKHAAFRIRPGRLA